MVDPSTARVLRCDTVRVKSARAREIRGRARPRRWLATTVAVAAVLATGLGGGCGRGATPAGETKAPAPPIRPAALRQEVDRLRADLAELRTRVEAAQRAGTEHADRVAQETRAEFDAVQKAMEASSRHDLQRQVEVLDAQARRIDLLETASDRAESVAAPGRAGPRRDREPARARPRPCVGAAHPEPAADRPRDHRLRHRRPAPPRKRRRPPPRRTAPQQAPASRRRRCSGSSRNPRSSTPPAPAPASQRETKVESAERPSVPDAPPATKKTEAPTPAPLPATKKTEAPTPAPPPRDGRNAVPAEETPPPRRRRR